MSDKDDAKNTMNCATGLLWLILVQPLWYALLFGILSRIDAAPWMWVCYWIYLPAGIVLGAVTKLVAFAFGTGD